MGFEVHGEQVAELAVEVGEIRAGVADGPDADFGQLGETLIEQATRLSVNCHSCVNSATQYAGIAALEGPQDQVDAMMRAFDDLVHAGKVMYVGVSDTPAWIVSRANTLAELRGWTGFIALQVEYSLVERTPERELIPMAHALNLGITAWSPLASGLLTGKYTPDHKFPEGDERSWMASFQGERFADALRIADKLQTWAESQGHSLFELAIAWTLANPAVTSCIAGAKTPEQATMNAAAVAVSNAPGVNAIASMVCVEIAELTSTVG